MSSSEWSPDAARELAERVLERSKDLRTSVIEDAAELANVILAAASEVDKLNDKVAVWVRYAHDWEKAALRNRTARLEAEATVERVEKENQQLRDALQRLSERSCGIPGHAVAVGCGASYVAAKALEGVFLAWCPDCHGHGFTWDFTTGPQAKRVACETCQTTDSPPGFLLGAASSEPEGR